jgi:hypothetical protein
VHVANAKAKTPDGLEGSLADRAATLEALAVNYAQVLKKKGETEAFRTRHGELQALAKDLTGLAARISALPTSVRRELDVRVANELLPSIRHVAENFAADPDSVRQPKAFDAQMYAKAAGQLDLAVRNAWRDYIGENATPGIERDLEALPEFRVAARRIAKLREDLALKARSVPESSKEAAAVGTLIEKLDRELDSLKAAGLDESVVTFVRRASEGVPLEEVLEDKELIASLRRLKILARFAVKTR